MVALSKWHREPVAQESSIRVEEIGGLIIQRTLKIAGKWQRTTWPRDDAEFAANQCRSPPPINRLRYSFKVQNRAVHLPQFQTALHRVEWEMKTLQKAHSKEGLRPIGCISLEEPVSAHTATHT